MARARIQGFVREANQAAALSNKALEMVLDMRLNCNEQEWTTEIGNAVKRHEELIIATENVFDGSIFEKDPLYAYNVVDAESLIMKLQTEDDIAAEWQNVKLSAEFMRADVTAHSRSIGLPLAN
jgi:hypothetical protein